MINKMIFFLSLVSIFSASAFSQNEQEPWTSKQLLEPAKLAEMINGGNDKPLIIDIGPAGVIKGSVEIGAAHDKAKLDKLKELLSSENKERLIVIYCGCCPYKNCPNVRPAFSLLNSLKFTNHWLLDLPHNLKVDWISQGYPMKDQEK